MSIVHNERIKLTANWINGLATAIVTAGALAPLAAVIYGLSSMALPGAYLSLLVAVCFSMGLIIHFGARAILGRLSE
jgi:hypothetical protein